MTDPALPSLIQQMQQPGFYPHAVTEPIELVQTHVSYVLLTGDYVYKVKKPVNFGFLDFSTLEKRHTFCQEELRLNQRGAAGLYIEMLALTQNGETFQLGGSGAAVEFCVKMHQFPQSALFTDLFDRGELDLALLQRLAKTLAAFHATAAITDEIRSYGRVENVKLAIDENYEQTENYIGIAQTQAQFDQTKQYTDRLFSERADLFNQRIAHNWVRECHGDVHLRNIALWKDEILLFDCIEFNKPFRFVDVMFDTAYIVMDLDVRDRPDLSNVFLNAYVEQTGDWEGLQILPFYISRQSYVRAKVTSFLLDDPSVPDSVKREAAETASRYYRLAWEYTQPKQGKLILMAGLSGSGKSTVARKFAREHGAIQIRSDAVRKHLGGIALDAKGGDDLYSPEITDRTYSRLLELGTTLATQGYTVILDAKYDRTAQRQAAIAQAQAHSIPLEIFYCTAPLEVLQSRLQQRQSDISDATAAIVADQTMEPFSPEEQKWVTTIDTTIDTTIETAKVPVDSAESDAADLT